MQRFIDSSLETLQEKFAHDLAAHLIATSDKSGLLLLSGGSAMQLYDIVATHVSGTPFKNLYVTMLDERFDPEHANYAQFLSTTLAQTLREQGAKLFGITHFDDPLKATLKLNNTIEMIQTEKPTITAVIGMGPDGHVSGIMPYPENSHYFGTTFVDSKTPYIYYNAGNKNEFSERITSTIPFILTIDYGFSYVVGMNKAQKLAEALTRGVRMNDVPFSIVTRLPHSFLYTDITLSH